MEEFKREEKIVFDYRVINVNNPFYNDMQKKFYSYLKNFKKNEGLNPLYTSNLEAIVYPKYTMKSVQSIIVLFVPYLTERHQKNGNISLYSMGEDYHIKVKNLCEKISRYLKDKNLGTKFYIQSDVGTIDEKFLAYVCGLGIRGINSLIIHREYGSYGNIGIILTDGKMEEKITPAQDCSLCMKCLRACPSGAIVGDFSIDSQICVSYLTQKKEILSESEIKLVQKSGKVFGCDICQNICPFNQNVIKIFNSDDIINKLDINDIESLSARQFKKIYGNRSFAYRGKNVILRNLKIIGDKNDQEK